MAGGANHSRLVSLTYPNGRAVNYNYSQGLDDAISRLTSLSDNSGTLESLSYLGLGTVVKRGHPQPGVDLTYIKQTGEANGDAGDPYTGLDRFGHVVDQRWLDTVTGIALDRFKYGYDRNSNRLYRDNLVNAAFSELYHANGPSAGYDNLNQLVEFRRGALSDTNADGIPDTVSSPSRTQSWNLDALGNWSSVTSDGTPQSRTHNQQNQVTGAGGATLTFDANGNLTRDETGKTMVYDAWNRLVQVKDAGGAVLAGYQYDALNGRIVETSGGTNRNLYYSAAWQVLEERVNNQPNVQYVWSPVYVDALVLRDRDADGNPGNGLEERLYVIQDANYNVTALVNISGQVVERYAYDPFGSVTFLSPSWTTLPASAFAMIYLHQGGRFDTAGNFYHFRFRDLSPTLGRWLQNDPIGFGAGDSNLYRYVSNSPTNFTDPSGMVWWPGKYLYQSYREYRRGRELDVRINNLPVNQGRGPVSTTPYWLGTAGGAFVEGMGDGALVLGDVASLNVVFNYNDYLTQHRQYFRQSYGDAVFYITYGASGTAVIALAGAGGIWAWGAVGGTAGISTAWTATTAWGATAWTKVTTFIVTAGGVGPRVAELVRQAELRYPNLAGRLQWHHTWPFQFGPPPPSFWQTWPRVVQLPAAYHQLITNAIRDGLPQLGPNATQAQLWNLLQSVYTRYSISGFPTQGACAW